MEGNNGGKKSWLIAFEVAAVWFGAHVGGGFATGNQTMNFFVKHGASSIWLPMLTILMIGLAYRESLIMANNHGTYDYKSWSIKMYEPFDKIFSVIFELGYLSIVLLGTGGSIAGSAALLNSFGLNYAVGVIATSLVFYVLTTYGASLIRKASSVITILILVFLTIITVVGIKSNAGNLTNLIATGYSPTTMGASIYDAFRYAGYQVFVIAIVLSASDTLKSKGDVNRTVGLGVIINGVMITLSCIMLLAWMPSVSGETLPILYICKQLDSNVLIFSYSFLLLAAFVSTGIGCVFGAVARFENVLKVPHDLEKRRGIIALIAMLLSMGISFFGLDKIVAVGYGYVGIIGIFTVLIPCIVVGRIKNMNFAKNNK